MALGTMGGMLDKPPCEYSAKERLQTAESSKLGFEA